MRVIIPFLTILCAWPLNRLAAQSVITHPVTGDSTVQLSAGTYEYYDAGGPDGPYADSLRVDTLRLCPADPAAIIRVFFTDVDFELNQVDACIDVLEVDGDANGRDGDYCGGSREPADPFFNLAPGTTFESLPGQCLIFIFRTDPGIARDGWRALVDVRAPTPCSTDIDCGQTVVCENFESFARWDITPQSPQWRRKSQNSRDAEVAIAPSSPNNQALLVERIDMQSSDVALLLGDSTQGRYRLSMNILVENGSQAEYNLQHRQLLNFTAFQIKLQSGNGAIYLPREETPGALSFTFSYPQEQWMSFVHILDLDANRAELWLDGQLITSWKFSVGDDESGALSELNQLGAINFTSLGRYYVDNINLTLMNCDATTCNSDRPCPVTVGNQDFASQCEACCAGYTAAEWIETQETPSITGLADSREWVNQGDDIVLEDFGDDPMLFVNVAAIDTLDFREDDIVLSNYCPDNLRIEVEDQRPVNPQTACYNFDVIWRVLLGSDLVDSDTLGVVVECKEQESIDSLVYLATMERLANGDTLRLDNCPLPDSASFDYIVQGCPGIFQIDIQRGSLNWSGDLPVDEQGDGVPCFRQEYTFLPFQCDIGGPEFKLVVEVYDEQAPQLTPPPDTTVTCVSELDDQDRTGNPLLAADSCVVAFIGYVDDLTMLDACSGMVRRTWTVTDSCGNSVSAVQEIGIRDTIPPVFTPPADTIIEGIARLDTLAMRHSVVNVSDNCGVLDTAYVDDRSNLLGCSGVVLRTWTVTDSCGNATSARQRITVRDIDPPTFTVPADVVLDCPEELDQVEFIGDISNVSDQSAVVDTVVTIERDDADGCSGTIRRTWTLTDECGNTGTGTQLISVRDTLAPTFVAPFAITISCMEELNDLDITGGVLLVNDNCGIRDTMYRDSIVQMDSCISRIERIWTVVDRCGNASSRVQRIDMADTEPPAFDVPGEARVTASQLADTTLTGSVRNVSDNCTIRDTSYSDNVVREATCSMEGWIVRTWRVEDWCGNATQRSQDIFYLLDQPLAEAGDTMTVTCQEPVVTLDGSASSQGNAFIYRWTTTNGNVFSGSNSQTPFVNAPGLYRLEVVDTTNGCSATDSVIVLQDNDLTPNFVNVSDVLCAGSATGAAAVDPQGGLPPYAITWSTGDTTAGIDSLSAGQYTVTVSDDGNCQSTASVTIAQPDSLAAVVEVLQSSGCDSIGTGQATLTISGGTAPYRYAWDNGDTTLTADSLAVGLHTLTVSDANGCMQDLTFEIGNDLPTVALAPLPSQCANGVPQPLSGGRPAGGVFSGPGVSEGAFDPTIAGIGDHLIRYVVTSTTGCTDTATSLITVHPAPPLTDNGFDPVCSTAGKVPLDFITPLGGAYSGPGISGDTLDAATLDAGTYPILYSYRDTATGCANSLASLVAVEAPAKVSLAIAVSDTVLCENEVLIVNAAAENLGEDPSYDWEIEGLDMLPDTATLSLMLPPGVYQIKGSATSSLACVDLRSVDDSLTVRVDSVTIAVELPPGDTVCSNSGSYPLMDARPTGGVWSGPFVRDSAFQVVDAGPGAYSLTYTVLDSVTGCAVRDTMTLLVEICSGTEAIGDASRVEVFPNPARDLLNVRFRGDIAQSLWLELWNSQGVLVQRRRLEPPAGEWTETMELHGLPAGMYLVGLRGEGTVYWKRVIVQE